MAALGLCRSSSMGCMYTRGARGFYFLINIEQCGIPIALCKRKCHLQLQEGEEIQGSCGTNATLALYNTRDDTVIAITFPDHDERQDEVKGMESIRL